MKNKFEKLKEWIKHKEKITKKTILLKITLIEEKEKTKWIKRKMDKRLHEIIYNKGRLLIGVFSPPNVGEKEIVRWIQHGIKDYLMFRDGFLTHIDNIIKIEEEEEDG